MMGLACPWRWKKRNRKIVGINMDLFVSCDRLKNWPLPGSKSMNKMIDLLYMLKYVLEVQEAYDEAVSIRPHYLTFLLDKTVRRRPWKHFSDGLKDQGICEWVVYKNPRMLGYVPDHFKTQEMCDDVVIEDHYCWDMFLIGFWHSNN